MEMTAPGTSWDLFESVWKKRFQALPGALAKLSYEFSIESKIGPEDPENSKFPGTTKRRQTYSTVYHPTRLAFDTDQNVKGPWNRNEKP